MKHVFGIDHLALLVRDLDVARTNYEGMGFNVSPRQVHSANMGSANHVFKFIDSYVELTGLITPTDFNREWQARIDEREGLYIISTRTDDVGAAVRELRENGISSSDPVNHSRPTFLPGGEKTTVSFDVSYISPDCTPAAHISICQHHDPDRVYAASNEHHPNTATAIKKLIISTPQPEMTTRAYLPIYGDDVMTSQSEDRVSLATGDARIDFMTASSVIEDLQLGKDQSVQDNIPVALVLEVSDTRTTIKHLQMAGVPFHQACEKIIVPAEFALGAYLVFCPAR